MSNRAGTVRAAGAVAWRRRDGTTEVALVHRPKYDDWSFPKGKLDDDESFEDAAVREVHEETGLRGVLGDELASTSYHDAKGRPKQVRYWAMEVVARDEFVPNDEVDEVVWVTIDEARTRLTYEHDRDVLDSFVASVR